MNFAIYTLGCKVNQYESAAVASAMESAGYTRSENEENADIFIVNSCTVTENSDKKARQLLSKLRRGNPTAIIVLIGCYPQAFPEEASALSDADIVAGNGEKGSVPALIGRFVETRRKGAVIPVLPTAYEPLPLGGDGEKTRAFVKIEDGCDRYCAYCIIPKARGRVRSRALSDIAAEIDKRAREGHKEIVLVGINLSCYGKEIGLRLVDAIETAAANPFVERVRLSSLEPELITDDDIRRMKNIPKLCPHFHLSLQSGCDATLKRMNRHYTAEEYAGLVGKLREAFPLCAITTDIMVGFAGETEEELSESLEFARKTAFAKIHVFTYSLRAGTAAERLTNHLPEAVKAEHYKKMAQLDKALSSAFLEKQVGTIQPILVERRTSPDFVAGHTPNYTVVRVYGESLPRHSIVKVKITGFSDGYCVGESFSED